jgi:hypothetical protein
MASRLRITGVVLIIVGILAWAAAGYAFMRAQSGADALQGFSEAQNVTLSYNDEGQLTDRGTTEGAAAILALLGDTWNWPIEDGELNPDDPLVNTATEYMYQMATIATHTLNGVQTVELAEAVEWDGDGDETIAADAQQYFGGEWDPATAGEDAVFNPGTYEVPVAGRYWTGFNRTHPLDGPARELAWNGTVHGLFAELGVGATTATSLQMAMGIVGVTALMGLGFVIAGGGLLWSGSKKQETAAA